MSDDDMTAQVTRYAQADAAMALTGGRGRMVYVSRFAGWFWSDSPGEVHEFKYGDDDVRPDHVVGAATLQEIRLRLKGMGLCLKGDEPCE